MEELVLRRKPFKADATCCTLTRKWWQSGVGGNYSVGKLFNEEKAGSFADVISPYDYDTVAVSLACQILIRSSRRPFISHLKPRLHTCSNKSPSKMFKRMTASSKSALAPSSPDQARRERLRVATDRTLIRVGSIAAFVSDSAQAKYAAQYRNMVHSMLMQSSASSARCNT